MEGVNVLIQMAKLDRDGNGRISKEEMDKFLESSKDLMEAVSALCLNSGVLAALFLSILFPMGSGPDLMEASEECKDFFGDTFCRISEVI